MSNPTILSIPVLGPGRVNIAITIEPAFQGPFTLRATPDTLSFPAGDDGPKSIALDWLDGNGNVIAVAPVVTDVVNDRPDLISSVINGASVEFTVIGRDAGNAIALNVSIGA